MEIHNSGSPADPADPKGATFKWSRDNASVATLVTDIAPATNSLGAAAFRLTVASLGRDHVLGFAPGQWIELVDEALELGGGPGEMYLIDSIDFSGKTITLTTQLQASSHFSYAPPAIAARTRIRRWDQSGVVYEADGKTVWWDLDQPGSGGTIPAPASGTTLILENGVVVTFALASTSGAFNSGDFWTFAARTADGSVETLENAPPFGVHHHYAKLSIVTWPSGPTPDCRIPWPPAGQAGCACCGVTVGEGAPFSSIQKAIEALPNTGGEVGILPGRYFEYIELRGRTDVVIKGCGPQTRIASPALQSGGAGDAAPASTGSGLAAVVAILSSRHVRLGDLCIEAADGECGVLLDFETRDEARLFEKRPSNIDVRLADLAISASTQPGILVNEAELVEAVSNRIAMKDVFSQWPAVYLSGVELRFRHNWVGLRNFAAEWLPAEMARDVGGYAASRAASVVKKGLGAPGGVQIAGASKDVFIIENEIEGGDGNGIALGSVRLLNADGVDTGVLTGVVMTAKDDCATTISNQIPGTISSGGGKATVVAASRLINVTIARNRIRDMGLCGIGPVGFFNLAAAVEAISLENLTISGNTIERSLNWPLAENAFGYGAICVPDVKGLRILDNAITDFGASPGAAHAWGIFVLLGELVEISRNRVLRRATGRLLCQTARRRRADAAASQSRGSRRRASPRRRPCDSWTPADSAALELRPRRGRAGVRARTSRASHRQRRRSVPAGLALEAVGLGPFSILGNHFATGGPTRISGSLPATTVLLLNIGAAIEFDQAFYDVPSSTRRSRRRRRISALRRSPRRPMGRSCPPTTSASSRRAPAGSGGSPPSSSRASIMPYSPIMCAGSTARASGSRRSTPSCSP